MGDFGAQDGLVIGAHHFADTLVSYTAESKLNTCDPKLGCNGQPDFGTCPAIPVLGINDGVTYTLGMNDRLELSFRCSSINEQGSPDGTPSPDFKIWATVPQGSSAVVEVSFDGENYTSLFFLSLNNQEFDLDLIEATTERFVRISDTGKGGIKIDAIEAY